MSFLNLHGVETLVSKLKTYIQEQIQNSSSSSDEVYVGSDTPDGYKLYIDPDSSGTVEVYSKTEIDTMIGDVESALEAL